MKDNNYIVQVLLIVNIKQQITGILKFLMLRTITECLLRLTLTPEMQVSIFLFHAIYTIYIVID